MLRMIRMELFRTLLMERVEFFDRHTSTELTSLLSIELDSLRSFIFGNVSRDRGLRAILEASGAVLVCLLQLAPLMLARSAVQPPYRSCHGCTWSWLCYALYSGKVILDRSLEMYPGALCISSCRETLVRPEAGVKPL